MSGGSKHDGGKIRMDLLPVEALQALGRVLSMGASKYGDRNWEEGIKYGRVYGALLRHLFAWWRGENLDPESGLNHLDHVLANAAFLRTYEDRGMGCIYDDRPDRGRWFKTLGGSIEVPIEMIQHEQVQEELHDNND